MSKKNEAERLKRVRNIARGWMKISGKAFVILGMLFFTRVIWVTFDTQIIALYEFLLFATENLSEATIEFASSGYIGTGITFLVVGYIFLKIGSIISEIEEDEEEKDQD